MRPNSSFMDGMFVYGNKEAEKFELLSRLFNRNYLAATAGATPLIPKIIHHIWLGGTLSAEHVRLQKTWRAFHPDWEFRLWTNETIGDIELLRERAFRNTNNLAAKSDILRYEILHQFGGLYVDVDFECLKPFDEFHHMCEFYAGVLPSPSAQLLNGLIGCAPQNRFIKMLRDTLPEVMKLKHPEDVINATGPKYVTKCFFSMAEEELSRAVIFPAVFFYPSPNSNFNQSAEIQRTYIKSNSYAIHYWHFSWSQYMKTRLHSIRKAAKCLLPYGLVKLYKKLHHRAGNCQDE